MTIKENYNVAAGSTATATTNGGKKNDTNAKMQVGFISTQLLNELSYKVPVAQVLKEIERFSNPEQSGLSSSICLEDVCI